MQQDIVAIADNPADSKSPDDSVKTHYQPFSVFVDSVGVHCVAGDKPYLLFGAIAGNMGFAKPDEVIEAPSLDGTGFEPVLKCQIPDMLHEAPQERMLESLLHALGSAIDDSNLDISQAENLLINILLPDEKSARVANLDLDDWQQQITMLDMLPGNVVIRFSHSATPVTQQLIKIANELDENKWDVVLFAAVDSLVDELTCQKLSLTNRIQTVGSGDGVIPGEAAIVVTLCNEKTTSDIKLTGMVCLEEPEHENVGNTRLRALAESIQQAVKLVGMEPENIDTVICPLGTEMGGMLEWQQTVTTAWPNRLDEKQRVAMQLGEIDTPVLEERNYPEQYNPDLSLGDTGIANVLVALALAFARFSYTMPKANIIMVCDRGDYAWRGAIVLRQTCQQNEQAADGENAEVDIEYIHTA